MAVWGLVGYAIHLGGSVLEVMGFGLNLMHVIPRLWELFVGVWLIAGFSSSPVLAPLPTASATARRASPVAVSAASARRRRRLPHRASRRRRHTPANARFFASPLPVLPHIVAAAAYVVLGAFQFVPGIRRRSPGWHRRVGRLLVGSGLVAALSGLWMTQFYRLPDLDGALLYGSGGCSVR